MTHVHIINYIHFGILQINSITTETTYLWVSVSGWELITKSKSNGQGICYISEVVVKEEFWVFNSPLISWFGDFPLWLRDQKWRCWRRRKWSVKGEVRFQAKILMSPGDLESKCRKSLNMGQRRIKPLIKCNNGSRMCKRWKLQKSELIFRG